MPERGFDTGFWGDKWVRRLPSPAKLLFSYLWTNDHCTQAGVYEITLDAIAFETGLREPELPQLLHGLSPKVEWYPDQDIIWVRNFLRRQAKSPKFLVAAIKSLDKLKVPEDIRRDFELYNEELLQGVSSSQHSSPTKRECVLIRDNFRCLYCGKEITDAADYEMDHIVPLARGGKENYLNLASSCRLCNQKKQDKTPAEAGLKQPSPSTFHGAQATYILKTNLIVRGKWLALFPNRYAVVESILNNIDQYCPSVPVPTSTSTSVSKSVSEEDESPREETKPPDEDAVALWDKTLAQLRPQIIARNYDIWLAGSVGERLKDSTLLVRVPTASAADYLGTKQRSLVEKTVAGVAGRALQVEFRVDRPRSP